MCLIVIVTSGMKVPLLKTCYPIRIVRIYQHPVNWLSHLFGLYQSIRDPSCVTVVRGELTNHGLIFRLGGGKNV